MKTSFQEHDAIYLTLFHIKIFTMLIPEFTTGNMLNYIIESASGKAWAFSVVLTLNAYFLIYLDKSNGITSGKFPSLMAGNARNFNLNQ